MLWHVTNSGKTLKQRVTRKTKMMIPTRKLPFNEGSRVEEVLDKFQESFAKVKEHQNVKQI